MPPARICVAHNKMHRRRSVTKRPIQERLFPTETPGHGKLLQAVMGMSSKIPDSQKVKEKNGQVSLQKGKENRIPEKRRNTNL